MGFGVTLSQVEKHLRDFGFLMPSQRRLLTARERARDDAALDEPARIIEAHYLDASLAHSRPPQEVERLRRRWRRIFRKMSAIRAILEVSGSPQRKYTRTGPTVWCIKFRFRQNGRLRQGSIHLGSERALMRMGVDILKAWRIGRQMREKGKNRQQCQSEGLPRGRAAALPEREN